MDLIIKTMTRDFLEQYKQVFFLHYSISEAEIDTLFWERWFVLQEHGDKKSLDTISSDYLENNEDIIKLAHGFLHGINHVEKSLKNVLMC